MPILKDGTVVEDVPENYTGNYTIETGDVAWLLKGNLHRTTGPAMLWHDGDHVWYLKANIHRTNGSAFHDRDWYWVHDREIIPETKVVLVCTL